MCKRCLLPIATVALLAAGCGGPSSDAPVPSESLADALNDTAVEHAAKHADSKYVCPMHPQIVRDDFGTCPICGMDLVLKQFNAAEDDKLPAVEVSARVVQAMGVRTVAVEKRTLWKYIDTLGYVSYDEDRMDHIHARADGWIEKLRVRAEGDRVKRGQVLAEVYSPEIVAAQEEYLIALRNRDIKALGSAAADLIKSAEQRLRLLEVPSSVIRQIAKTRKVRRTIPILAPSDGVVIRLGIREGMYVTPQLQQFTLADLSTVWVTVDVLEQQMSWVEVGKPAEVHVRGIPGRTWEGEVDYIYPELDPKTRTLRVRLRFPNKDGALRPNMLADAEIFGGPRREVPVVPFASVIETGERRAVVKAEGEGRFQPVDVITGMKSGDWIEIREGLDVGDQVVVSGQFLIDSESNLQASFLRMTQ